MRQRDKAREELIERHLPYVRKLAAKLQRDIRADSIELDELVAYGSKGLVEAADRFDPSRGVAFTTFSYYRIRGAIYDGLRQTGWLNRREYGRFQAGANDYLENAAERQRPRDGSVSTKEEAATDLAQSLDQLATIFLTSLEASQQDVPDHTLQAADDQLARHQRHQVLRQAVSTLPEKERQVVELYYFGDMTLQEVGAKLGSSKSWISRVHARAVRSLTEKLGPSFGADL